MSKARHPQIYVKTHTQIDVTSRAAPQVAKIQGGWSKDEYIEMEVVPCWNRREIGELVGKLGQGGITAFRQFLDARAATFGEALPRCAETPRRISPQGPPMYLLCQLWPRQDSGWPSWWPYPRRYRDSAHLKSANRGCLDKVATASTIPMNMMEPIADLTTVWLGEKRAAPLWLATLGRPRQGLPSLRFHVKGQPSPKPCQTHTRIDVTSRAALRWHQIQGNWGKEEYVGESEWSYSWNRHENGRIVKI
ncbi:hypothetical protein B0H14DRAFT_3153643 [Mycena olivaceomarginata]|nr:hypothetical protein B0H14DRAFT_3153643 [Mycena olivaceomarginata]